MTAAMMVRDAIQAARDATGIALCAGSNHFDDYEAALKKSNCRFLDSRWSLGMTVLISGVGRNPSFLRGG
jgi:hypothetical protein